MKKLVLWIVIALLAVVLICHDSLRLPWVSDHGHDGMHAPSDTAQPAAKESTATAD